MSSILHKYTGFGVCDVLDFFFFSMALLSSVHVNNYEVRSWILLPFCTIGEIVIDA